MHKTLVNNNQGDHDTFPALKSCMRDRTLPPHAYWLSTRVRKVFVIGLHTRHLSKPSSRTWGEPVPLFINTCGHLRIFSLVFLSHENTNTWTRAVLLMSTQNESRNGCCPTKLNATHTNSHVNRSAFHNFSLAPSFHFPHMSPLNALENSLKNTSLTLKPVPQVS